MFKLAGIFFVCSLGTVLGCASFDNGGDGSEISDYALTANPVFEFSYQPPVKWTTPQSGSPNLGQVGTLTAATNNAQNTVKRALQRAISRSGAMAAPGQKLQFDQLEGLQINVDDDQTTAEDGTGIVVEGTVVSICKKSKTDEITSSTTVASDDDSQTCDSLTDNNIEGSFSLQNGPLLSGRQWKAIADSMQAALILQKVVFDKPITVTT